MNTAAIVCVDDEWSILSSLGEQLRRNFGQTYEIVLANHGEEALALCADLKAEQIEIPVIISDQYMKGIEGDRLLIQLHALYPDSLKIMLTGRANADSVGNVVNAAALYRYIRKPWDETDLVLTMTEALRCFNQKRQLSAQNTLLETVNSKLENSLLLLLATLDATADGILVLDDRGKVISFNHKFSQVWHIPSDSMPPQSSSKLSEELLKFLMEQRLSPADAINFQQMIQAVGTQKHDRFTLQDNTIIEYHLQPQQLQGKVAGQVWSFRDVTQEKRQEAFIEHQAFHDALTNLPNRTLFRQRLEETFAQAAMTSGTFAVMFVDLDHFKAINDMLGHLAGDRLLQDFVQRLLPCIRTIDVLARWGGDEFVILLPNLSGVEDTELIASRLLQALQPEFTLLDNQTISVTASIGVALYPGDGLDWNTLLHNADLALYQAKAEGRNTYQHYKLAKLERTETEHIDTGL